MEIRDIRIKRIDKGLPLPAYEDGASGFDFICRTDVVIRPQTIGIVPSNTIAEIPEGYTLLVFSRSSTPIKKGLVLANSVGVVDSFFNGDNDEIMLMFYNITKKEVIVKRGDILAQGVLIQHVQANWIEVDSMGRKGHGGY